MKLYNTLSQKKELVIIPKNRSLRLFVCGPTVYNHIHLGNARTYTTFDIFVRYLRFNGIKIFYLQNITDIDDKIIKRGAEEGKTAREIAHFYEREYHAIEKDLGIRTVTKYARATNYISEIVRQIKTLTKKGHAYKIENDGYYFDISTFPDYGNLAKRTISQAEDGVSRIDESVLKRNKGDFALWKFSKPGEPFWKTTLGNGRPGWHIEDTAITEYFFGPQYDIHGAAIDLIFPHHEAEIAQQESASGKKPMVKLWMHSAFLDMKGEKMSKSKGNFITAREFLERYSSNVFRYIVTSHHYRARIEYDEELAAQAVNALETIAEFLEKIGFVAHHQKKVVVSNTKYLVLFEKQFHEAMEDDFNTPQALAALFGLIGTTNITLWNLSRKEAQLLSRRLREILNTVFGFSFKPLKIPREVKEISNERELLRSHKQFVQGDALRNKLSSLGYKVEDTPLGPLILRGTL